MTVLDTLSHLHEQGVKTVRGDSDNVVVTLHAITSDGYALCTSLEEGSLGTMRIFDAYLPVWSRFKPAPVLHTYKLQPMADMSQKIRPIITLGFLSKEDAEYYCQQHDYKIVLYVGEEKLDAI
jgi:hypothetical protein